MIVEVQKQKRRAQELVQVWDAYFPSLRGAANVDFWMVLLDDYSINVLGQAIKKLARKRLTISMTVPEMLEYVRCISAVVFADRVEAGVENKRLEVQHTVTV